MKSFVLIFLCFSQLYSCVNSLQCQYCSSIDYNSPCRIGTETNLKTCTLEGEDHCYVEYIINRGKRPLYRRGCAPGNWCDYQTDNHGKYLKFCSTCQGDQCNNNVIGSNTTSLLCRTCISGHPSNECRYGRVSATKQCTEGERCVAFHISTSRRDQYERGCGGAGFCKNQRYKYRNSLAECWDCKDDLCNNDPLKHRVMH